MEKKYLAAMLAIYMDAAAGMMACSNVASEWTGNETAVVQTEIAAVQETADSPSDTSTVQLVDTASDEPEVICGADESTWSPITDCESLDEAESVAGTTIRVPEKIEGYENISYSAMPRYQLVQVEYHQDEQHYICIRKAAGTEDISGDYNNYKEETAADIDGRQVTFKGNDGKVNLAVWTDGDYSYSVMAADLTTAPETTEAGLSAEQMKTLVSAVG